MIRIDGWEYFLFPRVDFSTNCTNMLDEQGIDEDPVDDGKPEDIQRTRDTVPIFPSRDPRTIFHPEELSDLGLLQPSDPTVLL